MAIPLDTIAAHCAGCGIPLVGRRPNVKRCRPGCGRSTASRNGARVLRSTAHELTFVGIDGEGVDRPDGAHDYNLLSIGQESLHKADGSVLHLDDVFRFIWQMHLENPRSVMVGFFLGYDFSQWLKWLPEERARMLLTVDGINRRRRQTANPVPFPVNWGYWDFDLLGMKRLKLRPKGAKSWAYVCDAGSFFQTSLVNAIDPKDWDEPICEPDQFERIIKGKLAREAAAVPYGTPVDPETIAYNCTENLVLGNLMNRLNQGLVSAGVKLKRNQWYGPGQAAQSWLSDTTDTHTGSALAELIPTEMMDAAIASYYGGWFELAIHGLLPEAQAVDINSAYPTICAQLPCLIHGTYKPFGHVLPLAARSVPTLCYALVRGSDQHLGAMLHRTPTGRILRPHVTRGWFWLSELRAAQRAGLIDSIEVEQGWIYEPCDCPPPLAPVKSLYERRLQVGKSSPHGKAFKLVYNSLYGKLAQSIGQPKFANPIWASLVTSGCRTMILDAIATHPLRSQAVAMVATDGILFTEPHPNLDYDSQKLGGWDSEQKTGVSLFKPGMYWDDTSRAAVKAGAKKLNVKSRGVNQAALAKQIDAIDRQWRKLGKRFPAEDQWPSITVISTFAVQSPKSALAQGNWEKAGRVSHHIETVQSANPVAKRRLAPPVFNDNLLRSSPWTELMHTDSTPYSKRFGLDLEWTNENEMMYTLDATTLIEINDLFGL